MWNEGYNGTGITIAVLDSGAWGDHPDLQNRLIGFKDLINDNDDMNPADGIDAYDDNGHGTAVAWNAVGDGTASGGLLKGIAPGANLLAIKVLDSAGSGEDDIFREIQFSDEIFNSLSFFQLPTTAYEEKNAVGNLIDDDPSGSGEGGVILGEVKDGRHTHHPGAGRDAEPPPFLLRYDAPGTEPVVVGPLCRPPDDGTGTIELPARDEDYCDYISLRDDDDYRRPAPGHDDRAGPHSHGLPLH